MLTADLTVDTTVLELGCGTGYFTKELAKTGATVVAVDISADLLEVARREVTAPNVTFAMQNACAPDFADGSFDVVVGSSVLHHLDVEMALAQAFRVLRGGGRIAFTEPNMLNPQIAVQKNVALVKRWMGDSPDETAFFKWGITRRLVRHGFSSVDVVPFDFLHPSIPGPFVPSMETGCRLLEKVPLVREIAGSLWIRARKA